MFSADGPLNYCYFADSYPFPDPYPFFRPEEFDITKKEGVPSDILIAYRVTAVGDIDGDGKFSMFERAAYYSTKLQDFSADPVIMSMDELE